MGPTETAPLLTGGNPHEHILTSSPAQRTCSMKLAGYATVALLATVAVLGGIGSLVSNAETGSLEDVVDIHTVSEDVLCKEYLSTSESIASAGVTGLMAAGWNEAGSDLLAPCTVPEVALEPPAEELFQKMNVFIAGDSVDKLLVMHTCETHLPREAQCQYQMSTPVVWQAPGNMRPLHSGPQALADGASCCAGDKESKCCMTTIEERTASACRAASGAEGGAFGQVHWSAPPQTWKASGNTSRSKEASSKNSAITPGCFAITAATA